MVLEAFVGPCPPGQECRHLDGDPSNNRVENLAWGTHEENAGDMIRHDRVNKGERCTFSRLDRERVEGIIRELSEGATIRALSMKYGVHFTTVFSIQRGETWKHVPRP